MNTWENAITKLRATMPLLESNAEGRLIHQGKSGVISRYQPLFLNPAALSWEEFESFLSFENNKHWKGLFFQKRKLEAQFDQLKSALTLLVDESQPLETRLNQLIEKGGSHNIKGMGKGLITPILLVAYPDKYSVWNRNSQTGLEKLKIFPEFDRGRDFVKGESFGSRYEKFNAILLKLAAELGVDLWTLDTLWALLLNILPEEDFDEQPTEQLPAEGIEATPPEHRFGLERQLQNFLIDNWEGLPLAKDWTILEEDGDLVGVEYPTAIGRIDLLCRAKQGNDLLVIELKRGQTSDKTMGQVQRYMGWAQEKLAEEGAAVKGLIIGRTTGEKLRYALRVLPKGTIELMEYEVSFRLKTTNM